MNLVADVIVELNSNIRCIEMEIDEDLGGWHKVE